MGIDNKEISRIVYKRAKDCWVYDINGKSYIDYILGYGPVIIGHANDIYTEIMCDYIKRGIHFPDYSLYHLQVSDLMARTDEDKFFFFKTSSEAVTAGLRLACCYTESKMIVRCGYIGWHDAELGNSVMWHEQLDSDLRYRCIYEEHFRGISNDEKIFNWIDLELKSLKTILQDNKCAAFIIDAYQIYFLGRKKLNSAIDLCRKNGVVVIIDETKTSGRVALRGLTEKYDIDGDIIIYGKAIANGAPLSILTGKKEIIDNASKLRIGGTFGKELYGIYSMLATQKVINEYGGYEMITAIGENTCDTFNRVFQNKKMDHFITCEHVFEGGILNFKFDKKLVNDLNKRILLKKSCLNNGILLTEGHPFFVSLSHKGLTMELMEEKLSCACDEIIDML